ncbi:hypothetical protein DFH11DRAFT_1199846 [Phellopilus nigrolimitatus]|nr:hypothetical protein DFH11DRAFT_1199846 [Phellopilus nigrolimitatus]
MRNARVLFGMVKGIGVLAVGIAWSGSFVVGSPSSMLQARSVQSQAVCLSEFDWMDNSLSQSPCIVAGYLLSECHGLDWNVPSVTANSHYTPPNSSTVNQCQCSWAVYNTLQGCAFCQGTDFSSAIFGWTGWSTNCTSNFLSAPNPYPLNAEIPDETAIPFWATTNPTTWQNAVFDPATAQQLASEDKPDVTQASREKKGKSTNKGAIAGGVVGGVVFFVIIGLLAFFFVRRRRVRRASATGRTGIQFSPLQHQRSNSDMAQFKYYNNMSPSPGPTLPVSIDSQGYARSPFHSLPPNGSYTTPTSTMTPPPEIMSMGAQPGKVMMSTAPMVAMNPSNPTVSSAYATASRPGHAHTLSNNSTFSGAFSQERAFSPSLGGDPPEGAITPYVLPPSLPEPMGPDEPPKGTNATELVAGEDFAASRRAERRNPPAYSPVSAPEDARSISRGSMEAQATDGTTQALSGTTLLQGSTQADQSVANDEQSSGRAHEEEGRDRHGYPADRKT